MHPRLAVLPALLLVAVACAEPTAPPPPNATFGAITVVFQGESLNFRNPDLDSLIGFYHPEMGLLSLTGTVAAGLTPPGRLLLDIDSFPGAGTTRAVTRVAPLFTVAFEDPTDSTLVYPYVAIRLRTDRVKVEQFDTRTCVVRGTFKATLFPAGEPPGFPVAGVFWGPVIWQSASPRPC